MRYARASRTTAASLGAGPSQPRHAGSAPMRTFLTARGVPLSTSAVSIHHFSATFAGPLLEGSNPDDSFWGDSSVTTTLAGLAGDDISHIYGTSTRLVEGAAAGPATLKTWRSDRTTVVKGKKG